jgi:5-methylcytosine-specific restriction endonuclease McrA
MHPCSKCGKVDSAIKKGAYCRPCKIQYLREYRAKNRDALIAKARARYKANPEIFRAQKRKSWMKKPEVYRERCRQYHAASADKRRAHRDKHRDRYQADWRRYWARDKARASRRLYRSKTRRRAAEQSIQWESIDRVEIYNRDGGLCRYCGLAVTEKGWHMDHIVPVAKGGPHIKSNVCVSCPGCNLKKSTKVYELR